MCVYLDLNVSHFGRGPDDGPAHQGGKDVLWKVGASIATLDKLQNKKSGKRKWWGYFSTWHLARQHNYYNGAYLLKSVWIFIFSKLINHHDYLDFTNLFFLFFWVGFRRHKSVSNWEHHNKDNLYLLQNNRWVSQTKVTHHTSYEPAILLCKFE